MLWQLSSPLLLFPEWIVFVLIWFQILSLVFSVAVFTSMRNTRPDWTEGPWSGSRDGLRLLTESHDTLRREHDQLVRDYADLRTNRDEWRRRYHEERREHRETCDILGPMLPDK